MRGGEGLGACGRPLHRKSGPPPRYAAEDPRLLDLSFVENAAQIPIPLAIVLIEPPFGRGLVERQGFFERGEVFLLAKAAADQALPGDADNFSRNVPGG